MRNIFIILLSFFLLSSGSNIKKEVDILFHNADVYTVDERFTITEAFVVDDGIIVECGLFEDLKERYNARKVVDLRGKFVFPGFIDAHCHFLGYALGLVSKADLRGTKSPEEIIDIIRIFYANNSHGWLQGRGWDQNDWQLSDFPDKSILDAAFPDIPVLLTRIDGHAMWVNSVVLKKAGLTINTTIEGGELIKKDGELTGILIDNAIDLVKGIVPEPGPAIKAKALILAQENCLAVGLTSVADAGLNKKDVLLMDSLHRTGELKMNVYAMLSPTEENFEYFVRNGVYQTNKLNVRSVKMFADGALGSRGALLLEPYSDAPGNSGLQMHPLSYYREICMLAYDNGYQVNTHAIGDGAVRLVLDVYQNYLEGSSDRRWRIEHAQVVHPDDMNRFGELGVIPSVQATHATSDMYWAIERLGEERITHAYAYKELMLQNNWIPNGTDFPVEKINPMLTFYASVARKDLEGWPERGFQAENALSREETLKSMTIWAARSFFEENKRGSLESGKEANFVVLDENLMNVDIDRIPGLKILSTYISGEEVFHAKNQE